jgi:hypothetical protein
MVEIGAWECDGAELVAAASFSHASNSAAYL